MENSEKNKDVSFYNQLILNDNLKLGECELESNLLIRKRDRKNQAHDYPSTFLSFSPYDFVYPLCKQLCCDSISNNAANLISQTIEFRLRHIIEEAIKLAFQRGSHFNSFKKKKISLPHISIGDINSAMRYLCGSPDIIWSSDKLRKNYYINSKFIQNKELSIGETNTDAFQTLPERTLKYIPCYSFSESHIGFSRNLKALEENIDIKDSFHKMIRNINFDFKIKPVILLHWLSIDGKFVFSPENDIEFIKKFYNLKHNDSSELVNSNENKSIGAINMINFGLIINRNNGDYLSEEQKEFLNYINRIFQRGIRGWYFSHNIGDKVRIRSSILNNLLNDYGLSEKDFDKLISILYINKDSSIEGIESESHYKDELSKKYDLKNHSNCRKLNQEELEMNEFFFKINKIFEIIEKNTYLEPLLPYLVYFVYYNASKICEQFEETGLLPTEGSLRLLIRISTSIIKNPYCTNTIFYINKIIEALTKIMITSPHKKSCVETNLSYISALRLIDNLYSRREASKLIENILKNCSQHFPYGGARIIQQLNKLFQKLFENKIQNLATSNCLHIASLYGLICGIRSLGDMSINSILFPKLLAIFSFLPEDFNERISYFQLYLEVVSLLSDLLVFFYEKLETFNENFELIYLYWKKVIISIEFILGDGILPIVLKSGINDKKVLLDEFERTICFLDQCVHLDKIDAQLVCPLSENSLYLNNKKELSKLYIQEFANYYQNSSLINEQYKTNYVQKIDTNSLNSLFKILI